MGPGLGPGSVGEPGRRVARNVGAFNARVKNGHSLARSRLARHREFHRSHHSAIRPSAPAMPSAVSYAANDRISTSVSAGGGAPGRSGRGAAPLGRRPDAPDRRGFGVWPTPVHGRRPAAPRSFTRTRSKSAETGRSGGRSQPDVPNSRCRPTARSDPGATAAAAASRLSGTRRQLQHRLPGPRQLDQPDDSPRHDADGSWPAPRTRWSWAVEILRRGEPAAGQEGAL